MSIISKDYFKSSWHKKPLLPWLQYIYVL